MLMNKFGKYHDSFADDVTTRDQNTSSPLATISTPTKQDSNLPEHSADALSDDATDDEGLTIDEVTSDVSTDANANNKQDAMTAAREEHQNKVMTSPDVNGNSKSSANEEGECVTTEEAGETNSSAAARDAYEERMRQELVSQSKTATLTSPVENDVDKNSSDTPAADVSTTPQQQVLAAKASRADAAKLRGASLRSSGIATRRSSAALREGVEAQ